MNKVSGLPNGLVGLKFKMHGKPRLWVNNSWPNLFVSIAKAYVSEKFP